MGSDHVVRKGSWRKLTSHQKGWRIQQRESTKSSLIIANDLWGHVENLLEDTDNALEFFCLFVFIMYDHNFFLF